MTNDELAEVAYQSYPNWVDLIKPLVERTNEAGGHILQIKQKFNGLRFYVQSNDVDLHQMIDDAEVKSLSISPR